ncbi:MAG: protein translocase subunit SecF [Gemmatimonadota bacterium]
MLRILHNTRIDFIRLWKQAAIGIALFVMPGLIWVLATNFRYSIEFTGGTLVRVEFRQPPDVAAVRAALTDGGVTGAEIATFGENQLIIRAQNPEEVQTQSAGAEVVRARINQVLTERFGADGYTELRSEAVGPRIGEELRQQASIALVIAFGLTLVYLAWRFEWRFAVAAVLATVHDIFASLAFMRYMDIEVSVFVVGAILTVVGYSMNDKVVVFDRVRENLRSSRKEPLYDLLNRSVNETLPRTVMTGTTTLASLFALLIFGGEVIRPFAWVLIFGILVGTFSSIYVASPLLLWIERRWPRAAVDRAHVTAGQARAGSAVDRGSSPPAPPPVARKPKAARG